MKIKRNSSAFNLPILLSFNELAWILIFGMGLFSVHSQLDNQKAGKKNAGLTNQAASATSQLASATSQLASATSQLARASNQLASATYELDRANDELARANNQLARATYQFAEATNQLAEATNRLPATTKKLADIKKTLYAQIKKTADLQSNYDKLKNAFDIASAASVNQPTNTPTERVVRQELLGLKGVMSNVAILLDRSGSMNSGGRWPDALGVVNSWLEDLPVQRCSLIIFSDDCIAFPDQGLWTMVGSEGNANRNKLMAQIKDLKPEGDTDTLDALKAAYSLTGTNQVDTIILFTDGAPHIQTAGNNNKSEEESGGVILYSKDQMDKVLNLAKSHPDIPVNVVAIGNYYQEKEMTRFLLKLTKATGGGFLGR